MAFDALLNQSQPWLIQNYLTGLLLSFIAFGIWIEKSPKMGGIFVRPGPDGRKHFNLEGILPMLKYPFQSIQFWKPQYWDLNFIVFTQVLTVTFMAIKAYSESD